MWLGYNEYGEDGDNWGELGYALGTELVGFLLDWMLV